MVKAGHCRIPETLWNMKIGHVQSGSQSPIRDLFCPDVQFFQEIFGRKSIDLQKNIGRLPNALSLILPVSRNLAVSFMDMVPGVKINIAATQLTGTPATSCPNCTGLFPEGNLHEILTLGAKSTKQ